MTRWGLVGLLIATSSAAQTPTIQTEAPIVHGVEIVLDDPALRTLVWTPGRCTELYRVWVWRKRTWYVYAETTETSAVVPVPPKTSQRWRVSAICPDGSEWMVQGGEVQINPGPWEEALP